MTKRRKDVLTGGSGDVKPQIMSINFQQPLADTSFSKSVNMPTARIGAQKDRATIMEVLKVWWYVMDNKNQNSDTWIYLSTKSLQAAGTAAQTLVADGARHFAQPSVVASHFTSNTTTTTGGRSTHGPFEQDLTDGSGNGVLIATDKIFFEGNGDQQGVVQVYGVKVLYRLYDASIMEYVGIVQSQQNA